MQHILLGVDHLLFVLGLLLIVSDRWMLVKTITSFTVAHSITLAIATLGYAQRAAAAANAAIALSILFLGPEIVRVWRGETSFTIRHPWVVAFAFGLLHGFGFASGLTAMGLPQAEIPLALLLFNVGVEIGQIAFVVLVVLLERAFRDARDPLAALGPGAARLRRRLARRLLDDPADGGAARRAAMMRDAGRRHRADVALRRGGCCSRLARLGARAARAGRRLPHRPAPPGVRARPRAGDGGRRPVGRAARRAGDLAAAGDVSAGHGVRRLPRAARRAAARRRGRRSRRRRSCSALMVACEARPPLWLAAALVGVLRRVPRPRPRHRAAGRQSGLLYSVGFVVATGCLHATGIAIGLIHRWAWGRIALRAAGAAVAAAGVFFLWRALA